MNLELFYELQYDWNRKSDVHNDNVIRMPKIRQYFGNVTVQDAMFLHV